MAWRETERSKAVVIRRTYRCTDCKYEFKWVHLNEAEDDIPECPMCAQAERVPAAAPTFIPALPGVLTAKSRAIDYTQAMAESQFGLTNMRDNQRVGDTAIIPPSPMQTAEREAMMTELVQAGVPVETSTQITEAAKNFWQGDKGGGAESTFGMQAAAAPAAQAARDAGVDPISILETGRSRGIMRPKYNVVASADATVEATT